MSNRKDWLGQIASVEAEGKIPIIAEIKPTSPASGDLLGERDIVDIARAYMSGGAACISVVTGRWFGGSVEMLDRIASVTDLPLLRKDLIVNQDQINQSADLGANAVLLTRKILSLAHLHKMIEKALAIGITPFIEVTDDSEIEGLQVNGDIIVAITNRDISVREMDVDSGLRSLDVINEGFRIGGALISASGIATPSEAAMLYRAGFNGLLVGSALLSSDDPAHAVHALTHARGG